MVTERDLSWYRPPVAVDLPLETASFQGCIACGRALVPRRVGVNRMLICRQCGMGQVQGDPMMEAYWTQSDPDAVLAEVYWEARRTMFEAALRHLAKEPGRRLLDLGGGVGHFAEIALAQGWDAFSTDLSPLAVEAAAARLGPERSLLGTTMESHAGTFDVVTLWCVVAHVADPVALLREAARMLVPGGRVLVTTPNFLFQKTYARLLNRLGRPLEFAREDHLLSFTPKALTRVAAQAGFEQPSFHYFGVTEECVARRSLGTALVPLKRTWNAAGARAQMVGLPPLGGELQFIARRAQPS